MASDHASEMCNVNSVHDGHACDERDSGAVTASQRLHLRRFRRVLLLQVQTWQRSETRQAQEEAVVHRGVSSPCLHKQRRLLARLLQQSVSWLAAVLVLSCLTGKHQR